VKKVDYYAMNQPWKMPKWVGYTLGGVFGAILITCGVLIVVLTRPASAAVAAAPVVAEPVAAAAQVAAPAEAQDEAPAAAAPAHEKSASHGHHRTAKRHDKHAKSTRVASAKPIMTDAKASAIMAKHDSRQKRKDKDALDKLLGL
jgi:hypothetical protein